MSLDAVKVQGISPEDIERFLAECWEDPVMFCREVFPHLFSEEIPWVHRGIISILTGKTQFLSKYGQMDKIISNFTTFVSEEDLKAGVETKPIFSQEDGKISLLTGRNTLVMIPRGFSKTTLCGIAIPIYRILFQDDPLTVYVSETGPHAKMQLDNVKNELSQNEMIRICWGDLRPKLSDDEKWKDDMFECKNGYAMLARGRGAQVRGMLHKGNRPKHIIVDDLEDRESVQTPEQRHKTRAWAYSELFPAIQKTSPDAHITVLGTLLHRDALLTYLQKDEDWSVVKFGSRDKDGEWLWPLVMDGMEYDRTKKSFAQANLLHLFYMEYENEWRSPETALIKPENIHIRVPEDPVVATSIYLDPAISDKPDADSSCIVVASMVSSGIIRIREVWMEQGAHPRRQIDMFFSLALLFRPQRHGVETIAFQRALVHLMEEEMARHKYFFEVVKVTNTIAKGERIRGILGPRYAANYITHDRPFTDLEVQLLDYPAGHDDAPDAEAGAIALLDDFHGVAYPDDPEDDTMIPLEEELGEEYQWCH